MFKINWFNVLLWVSLRASRQDRLHLVRYMRVIERREQMRLWRADAREAAMPLDKLSVTERLWKGQEFSQPDIVTV